MVECNAIDRKMTYKNEKTRSVTYRIPIKVIEDLEADAKQKGISHNVLVKQILEKYTNWDKFAFVMGMIPVPKDIIKTLGQDMKGEEIYKIVDSIIPMIKDWVLFLKGKYDLNNVIEAFEDYVKASGMSSDHRIDRNTHQFIIQHNLGVRWSLFTEQLLKQIFHELIPNATMDSRTTSNTLIANIELGSNFNEHKK